MAKKLLTSVRPPRAKRRLRWWYIARLIESQKILCLQKKDSSNGTAKEFAEKCKANTETVYDMRGEYNEFPLGEYVDMEYIDEIAAEFGAEVEE